MELSPVYDGLQKKHFKGAREKYRKEHEKELKRYHAASCALRESGGRADESFLAECGASLNAEKERLNEREKQAAPLLQEMDMLEKIKTALEYSLGQSFDDDNMNHNDRTSVPAKTETDQSANKGKESVLKKIENKKTEIQKIQEKSLRLQNRQPKKRKKATEID
ncbi:MAG: hypothetical protein IJU50_07615 [Lachnospiraceae bacterium]|nr:hypothetical protein [Lachnospiraceae bacterium]